MPEVLERVTRWRPPHATRRAGDAAALAALLLGVSLFHARGILPGQTFLPVDLAANSLPWLSGEPDPLQNWLISDPLFQAYPFLAHAVESLRQGNWPVWNADVLLGQPTAGDPVAQPFYPVFATLGLLLGAARALSLGLWAHAVLAALLTYGFLRSIHCSRAASTAGAFVYALSGYMVTWFETPFWIATLAWLPGVLWGFEAALSSRSLRPAMLGSAAMGLAILGGQLSFALDFLLFLTLYALARAVEETRLRGRICIRPLGMLIGFGGLGGLIGAIQILPFVEFLGLSHRPGSAGPPDPLPLAQLITLLVPNFYGNPASPTGQYWGALNFSEGVLYCGLPALLLACTAPFCLRRLFPSCVALLGALIVYVAVGGPAASLLGLIPGFGYAALHRFVFLLPIVVALLAALALTAKGPDRRLSLAVCLAAGLPVVAAAVAARTGQHWTEQQGPLLTATGLIAAMAGLMWVRATRVGLGRSAADWAMVFLVFADLFSFGHQFNPAGSVDRLVPSTPLIQWLRGNLGEYRVATLQTDDRLLFGPNVPSVFGLAEAGGYSSLLPARFQQLVSVGDPRESARGVGRYLRSNANIVFFNSPSRRLLDLMAVAYLVSPQRLDDPDLDAVEAYRQGQIYVYQLRAPLPRARVVYGSQQIPDDNEAIRRLLDRSFDLRNAAVASEPLGLPANPEIPSTPARIVDYQDSRVEIEASAARPGLLVLADQFHPGWQARVDGRPTAVLRVNLIQRGVLLPVGDHRVELEFAPASLRVGAFLTLSGLLIVIGIALVPRLLANGKAQPKRS